MHLESTEFSGENIRLYKQVANAILAGYIHGKGAGVRLPSERNLAELFAVSMTTIRTAMAFLEKTGHIERHVGSGSYTLGEHSRGEQHVAVLLEADIASPQLSPFYPSLLQEVRLALHKKNILSRPYLGHLKVGVEIGELTCREFMDDVRLGRIAGVICVHARKHNSWFNQLQKLAIPVIGSAYSASYSVDVDFAALFQPVFDTMHAKGRKHLAFACLNNDYSSSMEDLVQKAAANYGFKVSRFRLPIRPSPQALSAFRAVWKDGAARPDCLLVGDDMIFAEVQDALDQLGVNHLDADDSYVYGSDSVPLSFERPFTHCTYSTRQKAMRLVEGMERLLAGEKPPLFLDVPFAFRSHHAAAFQTQRSLETALGIPTP